MNISFSTTCKHEAQKRLEHEKFNWISQQAKDYILANIDDGLRVQCTMMYPNPQIEAHGPNAQKHHAELMRLL